MTDREANELADRLMREQGIEVDIHSPKHSNFYYKGITIENHKTFLNVETYLVAVQVNALLYKVLEPQFTYLMDGEYKVMIPPPTFNAMFLAFHASQHYGSGLALHHLCDWAVFLNTVGEEKFLGLFEKVIKDIGLWDFAKIKTCISKFLNKIKF